MTSREEKKTCNGFRESVKVNIVNAKSITNELSEKSFLQTRYASLYEVLNLNDIYTFNFKSLMRQLVNA